VIINALKFTVPVIAKVITDARIGPTHGVHRSPNDKPTKSPDINPFRVLACPGLGMLVGAKRESLVNNFSSRI